MSTNQEIARAAIIEIASEDEMWQNGRDEAIFINATDDPEKFTFSINGMATDYGCVIIRDDKADVHYHDGDAISICEVCGWRSPEALTCIHPGVFASPEPTSQVKHCFACGRDVPTSEL
jgi:hypothetical protein